MLVATEPAAALVLLDGSKGNTLVLEYPENNEVP